MGEMMCKHAKICAISSKYELTRYGPPSGRLGRGLATSYYNKNYSHEMLNWPSAWTDSLKEMDVRYGTWNISQVNRTSGRSVRRVENKK